MKENSCSAISSYETPANPGVDIKMLSAPGEDEKESFGMLDSEPVTESFIIDLIEE